MRWWRRAGEAAGEGVATTTPSPTTVGDGATLRGRLPALEHERLHRRTSMPQMGIRRRLGGGEGDARKAGTHRARAARGSTGDDCRAGGRAVGGGPEPPFTVTSDGSEKDARKVLLQFEQVRALLQEVWPGARVDTVRPVTILAARDEGSSARCSPSSGRRRGALHPAGVFVDAPDRGWVALRMDVARFREGDAPGTTPTSSSSTSTSTSSSASTSSRCRPGWTRALRSSGGTRSSRGTASTRDATCRITCRR